MHIPRFILANDSPKSLNAGSTVELSAEQSHHLLRVLRAPLGAPIEVVSTDNELYRAKLISSGERAQAEIIEHLPASDRSRIILIAGLVKQKACEFIVQRCVEAGAAAIYFFPAEHSSFAIPPNKVSSVLARWNKIAESAVQQSRSPSACSVEYFPNFKELLGSAALRSSGKRLLLTGPGESPTESQTPKLTDFFLAGTPPASPVPIQLEKISKNDEIYLVIGPEGGFSAAERLTAVEHGFIETSLGNTVLRAETAALAAVSLAACLQ